MVTSNNKSKREPTNGFQNYFMFNVQLAMDAFI